MHSDIKRILLVAFLGAMILGVLAFGSYLVNKFKNPIPVIPPSSHDPLGVGEEMFTVPSGYKISVFAEGLEKPRDLEFAPDGTLLVSTPGDGKVIALPDQNHDGKADAKVVSIDGLNNPHGIAKRCFSVGGEGIEVDCSVYVAEENGVSMYTYDRSTRELIDGKKIVSLPSGGNHATRSLLVVSQADAESAGIQNADGDTLLVSIGSTCNVCNENDSRRASVIALDPFGGGEETFARGLRNTVFMIQNPSTKEIWGTEMGRDYLGDNLPPDEVNILSSGKNYGWPICYGKNVHDAEFDHNTYVRAPCTEPYEQPSRLDVPAHSAPLGLAFVPESWGSMKGDLLVSYHGSWNRSTPTGYKVVRFDLATGESVDFITGWLKDGKVKGRPVDLLFGPEGVLYISDDYAGIIYRVTES